MSEIRKAVLLFGGRSAEHDVSILSARSIFEAAPRDRFEVVPICIARNGRFIGPERSRQILDGSAKAVEGEPDFAFDRWLRGENVSVVFPIVHGTFGEDGSLQGYLEILGIPYVGSGVTGSAVGMDKWVMKYAFAAGGLPLVKHVQVAEAAWKRDAEAIIRETITKLPFPLFAKPANAGSSVGVSKVKSASELPRAVDKAFRFDDRVLIEEGIDAREIEVSVLGNDDPEASLPGEIVTGREFYDYEDKYIEEGSSLVIPAELEEEQTEQMRSLALRAFRAVGAVGYARVDFFIDRKTDSIYVNEINTAPGFTKISMYPKLWEASGLPYPDLIGKLLELGIQRARTRSRRFDDMMQFFDEVKSLT
ncbi:MAG TPA: D-alanine--D-alanine ligase family protein [Thermoanaerobaculia bacterium]|nr:D-alanine--D-alanine ligase family protein [Thermoanaerobaculia bacterium]